MRNAMRSYVSCAAALVVCVLFQSAILANIQLLPTPPDLALVCVLYFSVRNGRVSGEINGFVSGLLLDFLALPLFGLNCMIRTLIGYIGGLFRVSANYESVLVDCLMGFAATIIKAALVFVAFRLYPNITRYRIFSPIFAFELAANTLLTPMVFKLLGHFDSFLVLPTKQSSKQYPRGE